METVTKVLNDWIQQNFYDEIQKCIYGEGKWRLAPGYESFAVRHTTNWLALSEKQKKKALDGFLNHRYHAILVYSLHLLPTLNLLKGTMHAIVSNICPKMMEYFQSTLAIILILP